MQVFYVPDMSCGHCSAAIEKAIIAIDPGASVVANIASKRVTVTSHEPAAALIGAMKAAGYPATPA